jgi:signal transduction histidine kinase
VTQFGPSILLRVAAPAASSVVAGVVGVVVYRRLRRGEVRTGLARPFIALTAAVAGLGVGYAGLRLVTPLATRLNGGTSFFIVAVPWLVFVARYVGLGRYVTRRRIVAGAVVAAVLVCVNVVGALVDEGRLDTGVVSEGTLNTLETAQSVVVLGLLLLVFALIGGAVVTTYRHDRLPTAQGMVVAMPVGAYIFTVQATRPATPLINDVLISGAFVVVAASLALGVTRYDVLTRVPATRRLGERAALTETGEAVLVLDDRSRVVRVNRTAEQTFGDVDTLGDVTEHSIATLTERKTITCRTTTGRRQFEPSISPLVDGYGETLGYTVTLFDVTDREIRRQRLAVLNRILRHNVRNELDVIRAHAESADLDPAVEGVDRLGGISEEARRVQQLMERSTTDRTEVTLSPFLTEVVTDVTAGADVDVTVTAPEATVSIDRKRCRYALRHLVENAVEHNDGESPRVVVRGECRDSDVRFVIADDGPGIPESERVVIESGEEAPLKHASGLGLWGANWAVQTVGGSLSFAESDLGGTAVTVTLPDVPADDD